MLKQYFVNQGIKEAQIEEFIKKKFPTGDYSRIDLERTPLGLKIVIYTNKPGRIIGRGGKNINDMTDALKERFKLENPQLDVKAVENANLDASIVAKQISSALERGYNYKKIGNLSLKRIMGAGALGAQIIISGKLGSSKGLIGKFTEGYLKHCGQPAKENVDYGFQEANTRPGKIGIKVKIMKEFVDISGRVLKKDDFAKHKARITEETAEEKETEEEAKKPAKKAEKKKTEIPKEKKPVKKEATQKVKKKESKK